MKCFKCLCKYIVILLVFLVLVSFFYINYQNTVQIIRSEYDAKHKLVEESIYNTIKYTDTIGKIVEIALNEKMREYSSIMVKKYEQNPNISSWDLENLKKQFSNYEIYIINSDLKVVRTTFQKDLGLDFSKFPSFSRVLKSRIAGNSFLVDRIALSTNTGQLMKYSYIPTPDHKYLLELSINISESFPSINNLDIFSASDSLINQYNSVETISLYKLNEKGTGVLKISKDKPFYSTVTNNEKKYYIRKALKLNKVQTNTLTDTPSKITYTYKYIPYLANDEHGEYDWWNSHVIEIAYNDSVILEEISKQKTLFIQNVSLTAFVYFIFVFIIFYLLRKSEHMAYHDHLTDLPNRKLIEKYINKRIINAKKEKQKMALLFLDLNNFKEVNDTLGHNTGDMLLKEAAKRLSANLRESDIVSRLGGDEFTILLPKIESYETAMKVATKINHIFKTPIKINDHEILVNWSIGISIYPDHSNEPESLMQKADIAMYYAKKQKLDYMIFSQDIEGTI